MNSQSILLLIYGNGMLAVASHFHTDMKVVLILLLVKKKKKEIDAFLKMLDYTFTTGSVHH